ncbi:Probable type I restriction enzyme BthVORF4518P M protein [Mycoplasmopsis citelli]|uniref:site-specific DNA-methyltransferase (adenine-specific) n=1 Tax=Mycoplasmopsis citelli TaxID=171281 RepID=A0A449B329_9BACT|nr:type I restriction-modification system subunit M [Mycoplasmopsis citelli]VEU74992.1 Probable type I restriction enzyme BthVORF4518P M protein [Mycoplasmopsis citelli]
MNKQELASQIWEAANKMRSKIEASEYKNYILGFIFYKFLSDKLENFLRNDGWTDQEIKENLNENDYETIEYCKDRLKYFISYNNLFSTWIKKEGDFDVSDVRNAINAFSKNLDKNHKHIFEGIFRTLETGISRLGENAKSQINAINSLIDLIEPIPMDGNQNYDVLGFIYEYLISMFAANAGKKAGEFYRPYEVSQLMSEIVANHLKNLKNKDKIEIYDPTSGSGSLLITIGKSIGKYISDTNSIQYYAQELKEETYNLTRMNLIMRGVIPDNIKVRNADTLVDDWPLKNDENENILNDPLLVDAVVSNPPYSQDWAPKIGPRFEGYGLAPKSKADYAFLLHDLYHLKNHGIMAIVLPHGVLFRGNEEAKIRERLIEKNNIETIISLPPNIFFGTGIPTIIIVLKKKRENTDILFVDASKEFIKGDKKNKLRAKEIKKIVDTVLGRKNIEKYSRVVSKEEIRENDYNLNISRYISANEKEESFDIFASIFGGIPNTEIEELNYFWNEFPTLKEQIFKEQNEHFSQLNTDNISDTILNNEEVKLYLEKFKNNFDKFSDFLSEKIINKWNIIDISKEENEIEKYIFEKLENFSLIDKYNVYQIFYENWINIALDLEIIKNEGEKAIRLVELINVSGKKNQKIYKWIGKIIPLEIVKNTILKEEFDLLIRKEQKIEEIISFKTSIIEDLSQEERIHIDSLITEDEKSFSKQEVQNYVSKIKNKKDKLEEIDKKVLEINSLLKDEKKVNDELKELSKKLDLSAKEEIENLSSEAISFLLRKKWIDNLIEQINTIAKKSILSIADKINNIINKYEQTFLDLNNNIKKIESDLSELIKEIDANDLEKGALKELAKILKGD